MMQVCFICFWYVQHVSVWCAAIVYNFLLLDQPHRRMCLQWVYELRVKHFLCLFLSRDITRRQTGEQRRAGWGPDQGLMAGAQDTLSYNHIL